MCITSNRWVLEIIPNGYTVSFLSFQPTQLPSPSLFRDPSHKTLLQQKVNKLLTMRTIELCHLVTGERGFIPHTYSEKIRKWETCFGSVQSEPIPKKNNTHHGNAGKDNPVFEKRKLGIIPQPTRCLLSYYNSPVAWEISQMHPKNNHYKYCVLPFGLTSTPRVFSKVLGVAIAHLR